MSAVEKVSPGMWQSKTTGQLLTDLLYARDDNVAGVKRMIMMLQGVIMIKLNGLGGFYHMWSVRGMIMWLILIV